MAQWRAECPSQAPALAFPSGILDCCPSRLATGTNPSVSTLNLQQPHACKGRGVQGCKPLPGLGKQILGSGGIPWDTGALLGALTRGSQHGAVPAPFPWLNEQHSPNLMLGRKTTSCHCVRAELLALLQLPATPKRDFNTLTLKKSRQVLPSQEAEYLKQQRLSFCQLSPRHGWVKLPTRGMKNNSSSRLNAAFPKHCRSQMPPFPRGSIPHRPTAGPRLGVDGFLLSQAITEPDVQNQLQSTFGSFSAEFSRFSYACASFLSTFCRLCPPDKAARRKKHTDFYMMLIFKVILKELFGFPTGKT